MMDLTGFATGTVGIVAATLGIMTFLTGNIKIADYLGIPYIAHSAELTVFLAALTGALIGFLWFNSNPATVFMGDTGSLALGGIIGIVAVMIKKEIFLYIVGGIFVLEALSVIFGGVHLKLGRRDFLNGSNSSPL
jgi:phospho-N-acetylmuramoyl-pentapeptide-transferase